MAGLAIERTPARQIFAAQRFQPPFVPGRFQKRTLPVVTLAAKGEADVSAAQQPEHADALYAVAVLAHYEWIAEHGWPRAIDRRQAIDGPARSLKVESCPA